MIGALVGLAMAYAALAALLAHLNLRTRLPRAVKAGAIVVVTGLYVGAWQAHKGLLGWATPESLPDQFRLHWVTVDEPDKASGGAGAIYFWVRELDEAGLAQGAPRAYSIPWDEATAEEAAEALARLQEGKPLNGFLSRQALAPEAEAEIEGADYGSGFDSAMSGDRPRFEFSRVPPPALPAKAAPGA